MAGALPGNLAAVLLAGGEGRRLGGTDKARLRRGAKTLLQHWAAALEKRGIPVAVVGPAHLRAELPQDALLTREDPPLGGPAAAARAGLLALEKEGLPADPEGWVLLLAVDVVEPGALLDWLCAELEQAEPEQVGLAESGQAGPEQPGGQAVIPQDATGRLQHLASAVPARPLMERARSLSGEAADGRPLRILLEGIPARHPQMPPALGADVDTPEDARRLDVQLQAP